jgi:predicted TIM-barrel fold metal-dependent hydrolase
MSPMAASDIKIIDTDTHITEPADLWTSRLPQKWQGFAPHIETHPDTSMPTWRIGETWWSPIALYSHAGWDEFFPGCPPTLEEADPACWDPATRLKRMDEYGIHAQVIYPNLMGINMWDFMSHDDQDFALACVRAYNDFLSEFASIAPNRFIPITVVPFWDLEATEREIHRCVAMGHRGILWANKLEQVGLPDCTDPHWDPIYRVVADLDLSVNFHTGFARKASATAAQQEESKLVEKILSRDSVGTRANPPDAAIAAKRVELSMSAILGNAPTITALLTSDLCVRFPTVKFVSVESGFGYIPYLLEGLDWQWQNYGAFDACPGRPLPSELFRRQCYGTFWFERGTLALLAQYPENFMFETDFPHPISVSPGAASYAHVPSAHVQANVLDVLPADLARQVLHDNAARVYRLD